MNFTGELRDAITRRAVFLVLGVLGLQVLFIISYVGALHSPSPSRVPFDLVAPAPVAGPLSSRLNGLPGQPLSVSVKGTAAQARSGVLNRDVYGALVVSPQPSSRATRCTWRPAAARRCPTCSRDSSVPPRRGSTAR